MNASAVIKRPSEVNGVVGNPLSITANVSKLGGASVIVDPALDPTSTNPVENKAIFEGLAGKQDAALIVTTSPFEYEYGQGIIICTLSETYANIRAAIHAGRDVYVWDNGNHLYAYTTELPAYGLIFGTTVLEDGWFYTRGVLVMENNYGAYIATSTQMPIVPSDVSAFNNDVGYLTGINSTDVTTALGYTPYNSTNPNGYVNASGAASAAPVQSVNGQTGVVTLSIPTVPSNVSAFTNDAGYITLADLPIYNGGVN